MYKTHVKNIGVDIIFTFNGIEFAKYKIYEQKPHLLQAKNNKIWNITKTRIIYRAMEWLNAIPLQSAWNWITCFRWNRIRILASFKRNLFKYYVFVRQPKLYRKDVPWYTKKKRATKLHVSCIGMCNKVDFARHSYVGVTSNRNSSALRRNTEVKPPESRL